MSLTPKYIPLTAPGSASNAYLVPVTGIRRCRPCATLYAASSMVPTPELCPLCGQPNTEIVPVGEPSGEPKQTFLFTIPPPPEPAAWVVEWRWAKTSHGPYKWMQVEDGWNPEGDNPWQRYSTYDITCLRTAKAQRQRLSRVYPWRSFRVRVSAWERTAGFENADG